MKLIEYFKLLNLEYKNFVVLVRFGNFYKCFDDDTLIFSYLFDYKIKDNAVGFPISTLGKIVLTLKNKNISLIMVKDEENIINYEVIKNNYNIILKEAKENLEYKNKLNEISNKVKILLEQDINNYEKIMNYLVKFN